MARLGNWPNPLGSGRPAGDRRGCPLGAGGRLGSAFAERTPAAPASHGMAVRLKLGFVRSLGAWIQPRAPFQQSPGRPPQPDRSPRRQRGEAGMLAPPGPRTGRNPESGLARHSPPGAAGHAPPSTPWRRIGCGKAALEERPACGCAGAGLEPERRRRLRRALLRRSVRHRRNQSHRRQRSHRRPRRHRGGRRPAIPGDPLGSPDGCAPRRWCDRSSDRA